MAGLRGNISLGANDRGPTAISSSSFNSTLEEPVTETIVTYSLDERSQENRI